MRGLTRNRAMIMAVIIGGVAIAAVALSLRTPADESPLSGQRSHEFGDVRFDQSLLELKHTFELVNESDHILHIARVATSCGCTVAKPTQTTIDPNERIRVDATLTFQYPGRRSEKIWMDCGDGGIVTLELSATARRPYDVNVAQRAILLEPRRTEMVTLIATSIDSDREPITKDTVGQRRVCQVSRLDMRAKTGQRGRVPGALARLYRVDPTG